MCGGTLPVRHRAGQGSLQLSHAFVELSGDLERVAQVVLMPLALGEPFQALPVMGPGLIGFADQLKFVSQIEMRGIAARIQGQDVVVECEQVLVRVRFFVCQEGQRREHGHGGKRRKPLRRCAAKRRAASVAAAANNATSAMQA